METTTRMGSRSSSRHGPAVQFSGRVRKWQKTWSKSGTSEKLQVFKWLPVSGDREDEQEELPPRKYRFLPLDIVHAQASADKDASKPLEETGPNHSADEMAIDTPGRLATGTDDAAAPDATPACLDDQAEAEARVQQTGEEETGDGLIQAARGEEPGSGTAADGIAGVDVAQQDEEAEIREALEGIEGGEGEKKSKEGMEEGAQRKMEGDAGGGGKSTAGVIEDALEATGLVEGGDEPKVEARALARVVALEAMEERDSEAEKGTDGGEGKEPEVGVPDGGAGADTNQIEGTEKVEERSGSGAIEGVTNDGGAGVAVQEGVELAEEEKGDHQGLGGGTARVHVEGEARSLSGEYGESLEAAKASPVGENAKPSTMSFEQTEGSVEETGAGTLRERESHPSPEV